MSDSNKGIAEVLHSKTFLALGICLNELPSEEVELIAKAFPKGLGEYRSNL